MLMEREDRSTCVRGKAKNKTKSLCTTDRDQSAQSQTSQLLI